MESLLRDDLFLMLRHGSALFTEEIAPLPTIAPEHTAWQTFAQLLAAIQNTKDAEASANLRTALTAVRTTSFAPSSPAK